MEKRAPKESGRAGSIATALGAVNLTVGRWVDWLLPESCLYCRQPVADTLPLCRPCRADLPDFSAGCRTCGRVLPQTIDRCGACQKSAPPYFRTHSAFRYEYPLHWLVQRYKFRGHGPSGRVLTELFVAAARREAWSLPDAFAYVPLHRRRRRARGFDQAEELATDLAAALSRPLIHPLIRVRHTDAQSGLDQDERKRNMRKAFSAQPVTGHIAIVDDVMTTGSTLGACARALKTSGATRVDAWVLARA